MDNQNLNIDKYLEKIPQKIQDFISLGEWQTRTEEIAKKYNLNPEQTESLTNDVMLFLIGIGNDEDFAKVIKEDLGVSEIVSDQIIEDVGKRVFEYALKAIEAQKSSEPTPIKPVVPKMIFPEVKPDNLPTQSITPSKEEKISVPKYAPVGQAQSKQATEQNSYKPSGFVEKQELPKPKIEFKPPQNTNIPTPKEPSVLDPIPSQFGKIAYKPEGGSEMVQAPNNVPKFNLNKETPEKTPSSEETQPKVSSIIDNKLKNATSSVNTAEEKNTNGAAPANPDNIPLVKQYSVDPYREPLA